jgi:serine protease Do
MTLLRAMLLLALLLSPVLARAQTESAPTTADAIYAAARPKLLQIQTLLGADGQKSSTGSGFLISADGLAITNYHVVSEYVMEPGTYRLDYTALDGSTGPIQIVALDVADDLALIRIDRHDQPFFQFDERAVAGTRPKGERLYSMGYPLDLGSTIVDGTYNGLVEHSYNERIHFSGAINAGMSGGPTVTGDGRIAGINVAKLLPPNDLVSFLVPARFAAALFAGAGEAKPANVKDLKAEVGRQLTAWQAKFYGATGEAGFRNATAGSYRAPESAASWFTCWAQTNADRIPKPRATIDATGCYSDSRLFVAEGVNTGTIQLSHAYLRATDLNAVQFSALLTQQGRGGLPPQWARKWFTRQNCHDDFVAGTDDRPVQHVVWCARAYRDFDDLYDVSVTMVTEDRTTEALVSRLALDGVSFENAQAISRRFIEAVQWSR